MLKYLYSQVYTKEIPNELSLGISVLGCPVHCPECHSPHMWNVNCEGEGTDLTVKELENIIEQQKWVSCILFFGGEWDMMHLNKLLKTCKDLEYKTALYSGHELDWFKIKHPNFHLYLDSIKANCKRVTKLSEILSFKLIGHNIMLSHVFSFYCFKSILLNIR